MHWLFLAQEAPDEARALVSLGGREPLSPEPELLTDDEAEDGHGHQPSTAERVVFTAESLKKAKDSETVQFCSQSMPAGSGTSNYISHVSSKCQNPALGALLMSTMVSAVNDWSGKLLGASPAAAESGMPAWDGIKVIRELGGRDKASIVGINVVGASSTGKTNAILCVPPCSFGAVR
jgi:hypothetical protein